MKDIVYINQGLFTAFIPQTVAGEAVFNAMAEDTHGTGKVLSVHAKAVIQQIKARGYTVGKAPKIKALTADELDEMMRELGIE